MQVQKDAPVELLLGTDTLPQLGFALLGMDLSETEVDLLQKHTWKKQLRGSESTSIPDDCKLTTHDDQTPMQAELVNRNCSSWHSYKASEQVQREWTTFPSSLLQAI